MSRVMAITTEPDHHIDMVNRHLDVPITIFDPRKIPFSTDITYSLSDTGFHVDVPGLNIEDVGSIWYRRPKYLSREELLELGIDPDYVDLSESAYLDSVRSMYGLLGDRFWVSDVAAIARAGNKLMQLELAQELGFNVPTTLVTSSPMSAEAFLQENKVIIAKGIGNFVQRSDDGNYTIFTTKIEFDDEIDFSGLQYSPMMFQRLVDKVLDIRVVVIGQHVFACSIDYDDQDGDQPDWRLAQGSEKIKYVTHGLDRNIANKCLHLVRKLGLQFGAIDLAIDKSGKYVFFEINPNGQWGFIEYATGQKLSESMAELLTMNSQMHRKSRRGK